MVDEPSDTALLERWRAGDAAAGEQLFHRHFASVYKFFDTKCSGEADELTQATFLSCLGSRDQFRGASSFRTFLFAIARNELYRFFHAKDRDKRLDFTMSSIAELVSTPGTKLARSQEHRRMLQVLQQLPVEQQTLLELHYWEDMGISELAVVFDSPEPTIRTRLHRARKALRERLSSTAPREAMESLETMDEWARQISRAKS